MKSYFNGKGYITYVDVEYPKQLHDSHMIYIFY